VEQHHPHHGDHAQQLDVETPDRRRVDDDPVG
jgi:hypothetical protein